MVLDPAMADADVQRLAAIGAEAAHHCLAQGAHDRCRALERRHVREATAVPAVSTRHAAKRSGASGQVSQDLRAVNTGVTGWPCQRKHPSLRLPST